MNNWEEKVFRGFDAEIRLYYCGKRLRNIAHRFGPYNLDKYLMYFIKEGRATVTLAQGEKITLTSGFFVNFPHSLSRYKCDENSPWTIKWIMADGQVIEKYLEILGITRDNPYMMINDSHEIERVFDEMYENFDKNSVSNKVLCISLVHKLFSLLIGDRDASKMFSRYVSDAQKLIEECYGDPDFTVEALAERIGLHYNYFSQLYKKKTGRSPKREIDSTRLDAAAKMLKFTDKTIKEIAFECGFSDELYFSRAFKKSFDTSPKDYRRQQRFDI